MTKDRFNYTIYDDRISSIYDRDTNEYYFDMDLNKLKKLLNQLNNEKEQLKKENEQLKKFIDKLYKKYEDAHGMNIENTDWF